MPVIAPPQRYTRVVEGQQKYVMISGREAEEDYLRLARMLFDSGNFDATNGLPVRNAIVGISRGGSPIATYVSHALEGYGLRQSTFAISSSSYNGRDQSRGIALNGVQELMRNLCANKYSTVCMIDDVFDTGRTMHAFSKVVKEGLKRTSDNATGVTHVGNHQVCEFGMRSGSERYFMTIPLTDDIQPLGGGTKVLVAVLHWKRDSNTTDLKPDFYVDDGIRKDEWIVYPWGAPTDLSSELLAKYFPDHHRILFGQVPVVKER